MNRLFFGDNLDVLRKDIDDSSVDLVYLDPPFNSQAKYNVLFETPLDDRIAAQAEAFRDTWTWGEEASRARDQIMTEIRGGTAKFVDALYSALGQSDMMAYLVMMAVRLHELRRTLRPTGSLYLHCDPTASHYLKVILDGIFQPENFRGEVVWKRTNARATKGRWPRLHDTLLFYTASDRFTFNPQFVQASLFNIPHTLITGPCGNKFQTFELTAAGVTKDGASGRAWRGRNPGDLGRHWANSIELMETWDAEGLIHWPSNGGWPRRRAATPFDPAERRTVVGDVWNDIDRLNQSAAERVGYPTQKPLTLLDRIIRASSNPGDIVLDPFCGCGTTIEAAQRAGRGWVGIDVAYHAVRVISARLEDRFKGINVRIQGIPSDFESAEKLAEADRYQFQWWANYLFNPHAIREVKKGKDRGIDGELYFPRGPGRGGYGRLLMSVKSGRQMAPTMVRDFAGVLDSEDADMGLFICLYRPTREMQLAAHAAGMVDTAQGRKPKLQIVSIEDWFLGTVDLDLPHGAVVPGSAIARRKARAPLRPKRPDPSSPQLPLSFPGIPARPGTIVHVNPSRLADADAATDKRRSA